MGLSKTIAAKIVKNSKIISLGCKICTTINIRKHRNGFTWIWYVKEESFKHTEKIQPWNLRNPTSESLLYMVHNIHFFSVTISCLHITPLPYPFLLLSCLFFLSSLSPTPGFFSCESHVQVVFTAVCSHMQWSCLIQESFASECSRGEEGDV